MEKDIIDVLAWQRDAERRCGAFNGAAIFEEARAEIERLRAGQFRWIAVSERLPNRNDSYAVVVHWPSGSYGAFLWDEVGAVGEAARITHWASIPPLPEPTQEEKDEKMFYQWYNNAVGNGAIQAFHAGLKAARGEK